MTTFDKREKAEEKKYALSSEAAFKVNARRNKLLGLWVAELLGLHGPEAEAYAKTVVMADFDEPGHEDVIRKVVGDLKAKSVATSEDDIRRKFDSVARVAHEQVEAEAAKN